MPRSPGSPTAIAARLVINAPNLRADQLDLGTLDRALAELSAAQACTALRATLQLRQNKARVEGAFGLCSQMFPPLPFDARNDPHANAFRLLTLNAEVWARTTHRPAP